MNKLFGVIALSAALAACSSGDPVQLDMGEMADYQNFLDAQDTNEKLDPFQSEPLVISAVGKVSAVPDIAVLTARISATDINESKAVNSVSKQINAFQSALTGRGAKLGFTRLGSTREFDQACRNENQAGRTRHNKITNDYWFNKSLDDRGDKETERREIVPRIAQKVCAATEIEVFTDVVIRITPADAAGEVLRVIGETGAQSVKLFGYDFTDYDALYQEAAAKSVTLARTKAQTIARLSGTTLSEIETFSVSGPTRRGRFGPQPNVIRNSNRTQPQGGSVIDRQKNAPRFNPPYDSRYPQPAPVSSYSAQPSGAFTTFNGVSNQIMQSADTTVSQTGEILARVMIPAQYETYYETVVVQPQSAEYVSVPATYETVIENVVVQEASTEYITMPDGSIQERAIPAVTKAETRRVVKTPASTQERVIPAVTKQMARRRLVAPGRSSAAPPTTTNALAMSLNSGPQTISVTATMSFDYDTPLDGKVIIEPSES